ncbi:hypothetical protein FQR65_LT20807 [Abscondita terminalis]|nr:hypothetical protein FQR65_LT20807 [Abscondita terminalis]
MAGYGLDGMLLIGGNGTQTVSSLLFDAGVNAIGLPKTIDNDLAGTDYTFGFDTDLAVRDRGRSSLIVVAEGFRLNGADEAITREGLDGFGRPRLGGVAEMLAPLIEQRTGIEARAPPVPGSRCKRGVANRRFDLLASRRVPVLPLPTLCSLGTGARWQGYAVTAS